MLTDSDFLKKNAYNRNDINTTGLSCDRSRTHCHDDNVRMRVR
jgi:hypothetical protein